MKLQDFLDSYSYKKGRSNDYEFKQVIKASTFSYIATYLRQEYKARGFIRNTNLETICLSIKKVSFTECCNSDLNCIVLRTESKVPAPLQVKDDFDFSYVGAINLKYNFTYVKPFEIESIPYRRFSSKEPFYTYLNGYIYLFAKKTLQDIKLVYTPSNYGELDNLQQCDGKCFDVNDINIDDDIIIFIEEQLNRTFISPTGQVLEHPVSPNIV